MKKVLIVNVCKEKLHYLEFVKPIEDILKNNKIKFKTLIYKNINKSQLIKYNKIIISGTSLKDNYFLKDIGKFSWIKDTEIPILGICSGMQIIGLEFGGRLKKKTEIGFFKENFKKDLLGLKREQEVYHLHNNYIEFTEHFEIISKNNITQAVKHKSKEIYGVLFHPEVRNKKLILNFIDKK